MKGQTRNIPGWIHDLGNDIGWMFQIRRFYRDMTKLAPRGSRVIDVGCGTGRLSAMISKRGCKVTGIDPNPRMLEKARTRVDCEMIQGYFQDFDFDEEYDVVFSSLLFHHIPDNEKKIVLDKMYASLKYGGSIILLDYYKLSYPNPWHVFVHILSKYILHEYPNSIFDGNFCKNILECGFSKLDVRPICGGVSAIYTARK